MTDPVAASIDAITDVHADIRVIRIRPHTPLPTWVAGQYMELTFDGFPPRPYSIASAPHTGLPEFHIRRAGIAGVSQHVADTVKPGDAVSLKGPLGQAGLIPGDTKPLLLIAGGMGLPPMKAMIDNALHHGDIRPMTLYWGTRTIEEMYLMDHFKTLAETHSHFKFIPVIGDNVSQIIAQDGDDLSATRIYLAGPPAMIHSTMEAILKNNAAFDLIHSDDVPTLNAFRKNTERNSAA